MNRNYANRSGRNNRGKGDFRGNGRGNAIGRFMRGKLLEWLYRKIDISNYKYKILESEDDLKLFNKNYYITPNYMGTSALLAFIKLKDRYYSFYVIRKTLSYDYKKIDLNKVRLYPVKCRFDRKIYDGTIFDGTIIEGDDKKRHFVVSDIYYLQGENLLLDSLTTKMLQLKIYLNEYFTDDPEFNTHKIHINRFAPCYNISEEIKKYKTIEFAKKVRGYSFYPEKSGLKLIYLTKTDKASDSLIEKTSKIKNTKSTKVTKGSKASKDSGTSKTKSSKKIKDNIGEVTAVFEVVNTGIVDAYNLYLYSSKKVSKRRKFGDISVPNREMSIYCQNLFDGENDSVLMKCKYDSKKDKWIPVKKSNAKKPDKYSVVKKKLYD